MANMFHSVRAIAVLAMSIAVWATPADAAAPSLSFTVNMSEAVTVDTSGGTPTIALTVDDQPRTALYTSGSGSNALTFTYTATTGDVDLNGIAVTSPVVLNGGSIRDASGNDATLTFTSPDTSNIRVNYPSFSLDCLADADGRFTLNGTVYNTLSALMAVTGGGFNRNTSNATYYDSTGTLRTAAINTPRFDYDPVTHAARGLLMELSSTNLVLYSEGLNSGSWTATNVTVTANQIAAPDGTTTADLVAATGGGNSFISTSVYTFAAGNRVSRSIYAKADTSSVVYFEHNDGGLGSTAYNLATQTVTPASGVTASMEAVGNGWYRLLWSKTFTNSSATASARVIYIDQYGNGGAGKGLYLWGAQAEVSEIPTSYIPTTTASAFRAGDNFVIPTATSWYDQSAGTAVGDQTYISYAGGAGYPMMWRFDDTTNNNRWNAFNRQNTNSVGADAFTGGVTQASFTAATIGSGSTFKGGMAQATNNTRGAFNGTLSGLVTTYTPPPVTRYIGDQANQSRKWIRRFDYYPRRITDTQLQLLTQ